MLSQLDPASVPTGTNNTIDVTIPDPSKVFFNYNGGNSLSYQITDTIYGKGEGNTIGQIKGSMGTSSGATNLNSGYLTFCANDLTLLSSNTGGDKFQVLPQPITGVRDKFGPIPAAAAGRIAYLYNHHDTTPLTAEQGAGLQLAIWKLIYDNGTGYLTDFSHGNFVVTGPYSPTTATQLANAEADAVSYITESAGKNETAIFLDASNPSLPQPLATYRQGMLATGSLNFGNILGASIGDFVWNDANANGIQDATDLTSNGINGVLVDLKDGTGTVIDTTTTVNNPVTGVAGYYQFSGLMHGQLHGGRRRHELHRHRRPLVGYSATATGQGTTATDSNGSPASVSLTTANDETIDFGYYKAAIKVLKLTNSIDNDTGTGPLVPVGSTVTWTYNVTNPTGVALAGVTVTDSISGVNPTPVLSGSFNVGDTNHDNLLESGETWVFTASGTAVAGQYTNVGTATGTPVTPTGGTIPGATPVTDSNPDHYYGTLSIGDFVWNDANANGIQDATDLTSNGINGVLVDLKDGTGTVIDTTTTVNNPVTGVAGYYQFSGLMQGSYTVVVDATNFTGTGALVGYSATATGQGTTATDSNGSPASVSLTTANDETIDFGYFLAAPGIHLIKLTNNSDNDTGTGPLVPVGSTVTWTYNVTNTGNVPLSGVTVTDNNGTPGNTADDFNATYVAGDANGNHLLDTTETWTYTASGTAVAGQYENYGTTTGTPVDNNGNPIPGTTPPTDTNVDHYYGTLSVGDYVWIDTNQDGIQDSTESGLNGVTVHLKDSGGSVIATTTTAHNATTNTDGYYQFSNLLQGTYTVVVATPSGYVASPSTQGTNTALDSNGSPATVSLTTANDETIDFGFYQPAALGDYVWLDTNRNGQQDATEPGVPGVTVTLFTGAGIQVGSPKATDANGYYEFTGLTPGDYYVVFSTTGATYDRFTTANVGNDTTDSDANATTGQTGTYTLASGEFNSTVDAGLLPIDLQLTKSVDNATPTVGSNVVFTVTVTNNDASPGVSTASGVTVKDVLPADLTYVSDDSGAYNSTTGIWTIGTIAPGASATIQVTATVTTGGTKTNFAQVNTANQTDFDSTPDNNTDNVPHEDDEAKVSLTPPASIGNFVWNDLNANGVQDSGEPGIQGVTVNLLNASNVVVGTTATDSSGFYRFTGLTPGNYSVTFTTPSGYTPTTANQGGDDATDSDAVGGTTGSYTLISGQYNDTVDAGFYLPVPCGSLSGFVYVDLNNNGQFNSNDVGIVGVTVTLVGAGTDGKFGTQDDTTTTTTTDGDGFYQFTGLTPGQYKIVETQPTAYNDGQETLGTGVIGATIVTNDTFQVTLGMCDTGINFNFGELTTSTGGLRQGDTATIGYWHNKNGQALIKTFNGGPTSTKLGDWLAQTFPNLYGNLAGETNDQIAQVFLELFKVKGQKTSAQILATAFAVYATTDSLGGGAAAQAQGFNVSSGGTGSRTFNVGSSGTAIGLTNNTDYTALYLLQQADLEMKNGTFNANAFNSIFDGINQKGDI